VTTQLHACPLCRAGAWTPTNHPVYRSCRHCGLVYQYCDLQAVDDYYTQLHLAPDNTRQASTYRQYLEVLSRRFPPKAGTTLVDVGAGDGTFLEVAQCRFPANRIVAVEQSEVARTALRQKEIPVVDAADLAGIPDKLVFSLQVIEHVHDPSAFLASLHLAPGERVVLTSPATDSAYYRRNGAAWRSFSPSHHVQLYNRQSLGRLFDRCGIQLLHYEHCYSGSRTRSLASAAVSHARAQAVWLARILLKGPKPRPRFHGKNSFLAIGQKV
jgi:hypothetical protein